MASPRVFVGPIEIAGVGAGLVRGFRTLGVQADLRLKTPHPFAYDLAELDAHPVVRAWQRLGERMVAARQRWMRLLLRGLQWVVSLPVLFILARRYDAFIFIFGRTITGSALDVRLLRLLGRRTIVVFCGSDARPPYIDGARSYPGLEQGRSWPRFVLWLHTRLSRRRVSSLERSADYLVNSPATAQFHRRPYVNWFVMGIPRPPMAGSEASPARATEGRIRILHSPSSPAVKGTALITAIVRRLQDEGLPVELVLLQGATNQQVLQHIRECDIVFDQAYSDTPMAALASEAAALGKPALVGGYFAAIMHRHLPADAIPPSRYVLPEGMEDALRELVSDAALRQAVGAASREFVQAYWRDTEVAGRYLRLINGDVPDDWWCRPDQVDYVDGCGLPRSQAAARVATLVTWRGRSTLGIGDNPALEARMLELAGRAGDSRP